MTFAFLPNLGVLEIGVLGLFLISLVSLLLPIWVIIDAARRPVSQWKGIGASRTTWIVLMAVFLLLCAPVSLVMSGYYLASLRSRLSSSSRFGLGNALSAQGKLAEAAAEFREAIRLNPNFAEAHSGLGDALYALGTQDGAVAAYREAIRLKPELGAAHYRLGDALSQQGKSDEAAAAYREAARLIQSDPT